MLKRTLRWAALAWDGAEHLELRETSDEIVANSVVVGSFNGFSHGTRYEVPSEPRVGLSVAAARANGWTAPGTVARRR